MKKQLPWFEILLIVVALSIQLYAALSDAYNLPNAWFIRDDAYYYFKVAQNVGEGLGSTFDGTHLTNGYHPLWLLVCIPVFTLARFDLILPLRVLLILISILNIATGILLYHLLKGSLSRPVGMLAAIYWVFNSSIERTFYETGLESGITIFFIVLLIYELSKLERNPGTEAFGLSQIAWLGGIGTLAVFSRLDLIFFVVIVGIWIVFRKTPMRYLLPLDILGIFASTLMAFLARLGFPQYYDSAPSAILMILTGILVGIPIFYAFGLYEMPANWGPMRMLRNVVLATALSSLSLSLLLLTGSAFHVFPDFSRTILLLNAAFILAAMLLIRAAAFGLRNREAKKNNYPSPLMTLKGHWRQWLKEGSVYYGIVGGALAAYMLWNKLEFGTSSPVSGQLKRWWGTFAINVYGGAAKTFLSFIMLNPENDFNAWEPATTLFRKLEGMLIYRNFHWAVYIKWQLLYPFFVASILLGIYLFLLLKRKRTRRALIEMGLIPLFVGSWFQIFSYNVTGYASPKEWYWLTEQLLLVLSTLLIVDVAFSILLKKWPSARMLIWTLVAFFGLRTVFNYWQDVRSQMPYGINPPGTPYMLVVPLLESLTKPGDIIGMTGGGNVGYFIHDRTIVNMDGLINSYDYFQALKNGTGADYLYNTGMRYVFANPGILSANPYRGQYTDRLQPIIDWGGKDLMRLLPKPAQ